MINKWVYILGVSILALGLTACSDTTDNEDAPKEQNTQNETPTNEPTEQTPNDFNEKKSNQSNDDEDNTNNDGEETSHENEDNTGQHPGDPTITALVNKQHSLDDNYIPDDLVTVHVPTVLDNSEVNQLREVAADALKSMFDKAKESGIDLHARSGYRSYQTQVHLFQNYLEKHGEAAANRYSAKPGQSEHQTGLVMDVTSKSVDYQLAEHFDETEEGKWLKEHAHEFGFIIRYPEDAEDITGYMYEPWHIRYLGVDMATHVYESELTYEEYLNKEGMIHEENS